MGDSSSHTVLPSCAVVHCVSHCCGYFFHERFFCINNKTSVHSHVRRVDPLGLKIAEDSALSIAMISGFIWRLSISGNNSIVIVPDPLESCNFFWDDFSIAYRKNRNKLLKCLVPSSKQLSLNKATDYFTRRVLL